MGAQQAGHAESGDKDGREKTSGKNGYARSASASAAVLRSGKSEAESHIARGSANTKIQPLNRNTVRKGSNKRTASAPPTPMPNPIFRQRSRSSDSLTTPPIARKLGHYLQHGIPPEHRIVVIGDLHGMLHKIKALWKNLETGLGRDVLEKALVVFLGDYCDRGLHVKGTLDWLCALQQERNRVGARTVFLLGNHEFCLLGFLGLLPRPRRDPGFSFRQTWDRDEPAINSKERTRWWGSNEIEEVLEEVHLQGRRWGGTYYEKSYGSAATFASYSARHGDRAALLRGLPQSHLDFLAGCPWVHVEDNPVMGRCVFVHAGLEADGSEDCEAQIQRLQDRDARDPHPQPLFGRDGVLHTPPQLARKGTTVISGHHGRVIFKTHRIILDSCCGDEKNALVGIVLPEAVQVKDDGGVEKGEGARVFDARTWLSSTLRASQQSCAGIFSERNAVQSAVTRGSTLSLVESQCNSRFSSSTLSQFMPLGDSAPLEVSWSGGASLDNDVH